VRTRAALPALLASALLLVALVLAPAAGAKPHVRAANPSIKLGSVVLSTPTTPGGGAALLIPVRYPIEFSGRVTKLEVALVRPGRGEVASWKLHERVTAGPLRIGDPRQGFLFVHRVGLKPSLVKLVREGVRIQVRAGGDLDVNQDGVPELRSHAHPKPLVALTPASNRSRYVCNSVPRISIAPGKRVSIPLPACSDALVWRIARGPEGGKARIVNGRLVYTAPKGARGSQSLVLRGRPPSQARASLAGAEPGVETPVVLTVGAASGAVVRAIGDSVTAGFGYYGDGRSMSILNLPECRPGAPYNDACSSNSEVVTAGGSVFIYAPDYGLANNVSWAAQWANEYGITNYENLAVSGSEPKDWAPGGVLYGTTEEVEGENPDYILMTIGANPLLSEMLFGAENMGCAIYSEVFGEYAKCIEKAFAGVQLQAHLKDLYTELVAKTDATIYLMQYPLTVPSSALAYSATQIAEMGQLLDREIAKVAGEVSPSRLHPVAPPHFNVGISVEPVYPSSYTCGYPYYPVDGPSVQSTPTQYELKGLHLPSFCSGPKPKEPNWVISGDTGIHPSATGYSHMAAQIPPPAQG
jgi:lysophospholipase L1-like esterase